MNITKTKLGVLAVLSALGGQAVASPDTIDCQSNSEGLASALASGPSFYESQLNYYLSDPFYVAEGSACFNGSVTISDNDVRAAILPLANTLSNVASNRLLPNAGPQTQALVGTEGMAAGGVAGRWNLWANTTDNDSRYSHTSNSGIVRTTADTDTYVVGGDIALMPNLILGVSGSFDRTHGKADSAGNRLRSDGYMVAAYLGLQLSEKLALDVAIGSGDADRKTGAQTKNDIDRDFYAANLTYAHWHGALQVTGKASWLHGKEDVGDNVFAGTKLPGTGGTTKLNQGKLGAEVGYWIDGFMPYVGVAYARDTSRTKTVEPWDKTALVWSAGVNFFSLKNKITGGIGYQGESNRSHTENDTWTANISMAF